jgi:hypothetical protein
MDRQQRRLELYSLGLVVLLLALSYGYFLQGGGWNQCIRLDLAWSLVERGTVSIDAYAANTGDVAIREGHLYSTKAPGSSFLAVPLVMTLRVVQDALGVDPYGAAGRVAQGHWVTWIIAGWGSALLAGLVGWAARRWYGASLVQQVFVALAFGLGTIAFPFATVLMGHSLAALLGVASLLLVLPGPWNKLRPGWAGFLASFAMVTDYPAVVFLGVNGLVLLWTQRDWRSALRYALGALGPILLLAGYHHACFGSPLATGYDYQTEMFQHHDEAVLLGLFSLPRPDRLLAITLGAKRGLFYLFPVCLLLLGAPFVAWRRPAARVPLLAGWAIFLWFLLLNASYPVWDGGYSSGPRHLIAGLPLVMIPVALTLYDRWRWPVAALAALSTLLATAITAVNPLGPYQVDRLLWDYILPKLFAGAVSQNFFTWWPGWKPANPQEATAAAVNLGELMGYQGMASLLPLALLWLLGGAGLFLLLRRR